MLHVHELPELSDTMRLMTVRSEGQFNTVVYEDDDLYRGQERRDVILLHPDDIARLGLRAGGRVCVTSEIGEMQNVLVHAFADIKPGNAVMYYPEANALVPRRLDPLSKTPAFKCVIVTVTPMPERTERKSTMSSGNERDLVTIVPPDGAKKQPRPDAGVLSVVSCPVRGPLL